ncbi:high mobility group protein B4-like [Rattus rattus]|uniref:high mobility group protein B4-like n=1 Tax=Rattus rattus TaxID=10117 RepID=UPI0013F2CCF0|nr:high mobility group protein B4-like [Rattus rattus]
MGKHSNVRPKVNVSPYVHFMMDFRNQMREQQPIIYYDFTEFSRKCSEKWRTISEQEKKKYEALAKRDKDRYQREMRNYTGPRRERRRRDVNAPRKPPSSFLLFSMDHFDEIKEQHPNWTVGQVAKAAKRMWSRCSEADKSHYVEKAAVLRAKYLEEREAYYRQCQRGN